MEPRLRISFLWDEQQRVKDGKSSAVAGYATGVSLHSHTSLSEESLTFIDKMAREMSWLRNMFERAEKRTIARHKQSFFPP